MEPTREPATEQVADPATEQATDRGAEQVAGATMERTQYRYRANPWIGAFGTVFFGAATWIIARDAMMLEGPVTTGRLRLPAVWANEGLAVLALASAALTLAALAMLLLGGRGAGRIVLDATGIEAPKSALSRNCVTLPYDAISATRLRSLRGKQFFEITHAGGTLTVAASSMRRADFAALVAALSARTGGRVG